MFLNLERLLVLKKVDDFMINVFLWNYIMIGRLLVVCVVVGVYMFSDKQFFEMNGVFLFGKNCVFCGYEGLYCLVENGVEN